MKLMILLVGLMLIAMAWLMVVMLPRVRNTEAGTEVPLTTYNHLQSPGATAEDRVYKSILHGLSCGTYRECSALIPEALSLSP